MQQVDFVTDLGVNFVADWVFLVGRVVGNGQDWYWMSNDIVEEDIGTWDYKRLVESLAIGNYIDNMRFSLVFPLATPPKSPITRIHKSNIIKFSFP